MQSIPLWEVNETLPMEVGELAPQFRKRLGWKEHHPELAGDTAFPNECAGRTLAVLAHSVVIIILGRSLDVWRSRTLRLTAEAKRQLFSSAKLWGLQVPRVSGDHTCIR
jgi:hypothetical protein